MNVLSFSILRALEISFSILFKKLHWFIFPIILFVFAEHYEIFISYFNLQEWWNNQLKDKNFIYILISFEFVIALMARVIFTQIALNLTIENSNKNYWTFIPRFMVFLKFIIASIIYYLLIIIGFIFFVYPGIVFLLRLQFYKYYIVEYNAGIIESFKASWNITTNEKIKLFFFIFVMIIIFHSTVLLKRLTLVTNLNEIFLLIPLFVALLLAFGTLVQANVYCQLKPQIEPIEDETL